MGRTPDTYIISKGYQYTDYKSQAFTGEEVTYVIGTVAGEDTALIILQLNLLR